MVGATFMHELKAFRSGFILLAVLVAPSSAAALWSSPDVTVRVMAGYSEAARQTLTCVCSRQVDHRPTR
jgi:hypothetical protein